MVPGRLAAAAVLSQAGQDGLKSLPPDVTDYIDRLIFELRPISSSPLLLDRHGRGRRGGGGFLGVARQPQRFEPRRLGAVGGRGVFVFQHRALALFGLPQLLELVVRHVLLAVVGQCSLHW